MDVPDLVDAVPLMHPLARIVALGLLAFAAERAWLAPHGPSPAAPALDEEALLARAALALGLDRGDPVIERRLATNLLSLRDADAGGAEALPADAEELRTLVAEAEALGMPPRDVVVRRRLANRLRLRVGAAARARKVDAEALAAHLARHAARFERPARVRVRHDAGPLGWPAPVPNTLLSEAELAMLVGPEIAHAAFELERGRWSDPIDWAGARHRVQVLAREPARAPRLEEVRDAVRASLLAEREAEDWAAFVRALRARGAVP
jgi:hypothetical protein